MARAVRTSTTAKGRPSTTRGRGPAGQNATEREGNYFVGVVNELRKVTWPTGDELWRMTTVVIATVILFAVIIGVADFLLAKILEVLYHHQGGVATPRKR